MQLQFHKTAVTCLQRIRSDVQYQEQTQELRLPEEMADIGSVIGAWGQVLIRGKEWRSGSMNVSGGVMAWAMYLPEDGNEPQMVEAWIPFQMKWDLPETQYDGVIRVSPLLKSVDARITSARKLMLRVCVGVLSEATVPMETEVFTPEQIPDGVYLLERTYPVQLPKEAGEKPFSMEEELTLPSSAPAMEKLLRFSLQPELIDQKVMSGKVVFRGMGLVHILYTGTDGQLHCWDFEIPFSQYAELESDYEQEATADIWMAVTALEMDTNPEGQLCLKAGLTGQYRISDRQIIQVVEDAYGTAYKVESRVEQLQLPILLDEQKQLIHAQGTGNDTHLRGVDVAFYPDQPRLERDDGVVTGNVNGYFQVLGYDSEGKPAGTVERWNDTVTAPGCGDCHFLMQSQPSGTPQLSGMGGAPGGDLLLRTTATATKGIPMVTQIEMEQTQPDPQRPSLILRRAGEENLWTIAKESGSTEQAIREANKLSGEPEPGQVLLIPVV